MPNYSLSQVPATMFELNNIFETMEGVTSPQIIKDPSWLGLIKASPAAFVITVYRPFIWEGRGLTGLLAAIENLILLIVSLRAVLLLFQHPSLFKRAWRSPLFRSCLIFVFLYSIVVAGSTPNFGSISRYRIPLIPFLVGALAILQYHYLELPGRMRSRRIELGTHAQSTPST